MRKVSLRMNEEQKYQTIKELADHGSNQQRVALKLGVCVRTVNRYVTAYRSKGTVCLVIKAFDGQLFAAVDDQVYALREVPKYAVSSPEFDPVVPPAPKKRYIPPMSHPWKRSYFLQIQDKTHRQLRIA